MAAPSIRNVAIIAHVDHGKTTLVDGLLRQAGTFRSGEVVTERAMDSNDLERERGITILSKCTAVTWKGTRINIVDTPGHADFGGEVERVLGMVDSVLLLVDAYEGAMPQTRFVTQKAFEMGLSPIVVVNKIDRSDSRVQEVLDEVFDLFVTLDATDEQLDFPVLYASGRNGYASEDPDAREGTLTPLFEKIVSHVPAPALEQDAPFSFLVTLLDRDNFLGRILTGRVEQGTARINMPVRVLRQDGTVVESGRLTKLMTFSGLDRVPVDEVQAGDICAIAGLSDATIPDTIAAPEVAAPLAAVPVDPPTLAMTFRINDGPLGGREGKKVTSRQIRDRLSRPVSLTISGDPGRIGTSGTAWFAFSAQSCARSAMARGFSASGMNSAKRPARTPMPLSFCRTSGGISRSVAPGAMPRCSRNRKAGPRSAPSAPPPPRGFFGHYGRRSSGLSHTFGRTLAT